VRSNAPVTAKLGSPFTSIAALCDSGSFCDGTTSLNFLDLLDGPDEACGQDGSADLAGMPQQ
jgi:hypothetical protein